jgi:hypothetical protein
MKRAGFIFGIFVLYLTTGVIVLAATSVPNEIKQPGTQPGEAGNLESPDKCDNCHGGYDHAVEPTFNWQGSMMANASRDPVFWATLAIAEQDFPGSGDLCIRCHSTSGYYAGRSVPTDGSGLQAADATGVECDFCHKMTNTNQLEHPGVMNPPYIANDGGTPAIGYYGSGMAALSAGSAKLGPYSDADARHQWAQSLFHRDIDFCGVCHDVSNPAVGDLAHNNGTLPSGDPVIASGELGSPVELKAAFNNLPFQYGIVERTYSEYKAGALSKTLVSDYATLPADLQAGAIQAVSINGGDYADGAARYYSCQTCHMKAVTGYGANKANLPLRTDLPLHDMTGGNYWMPDVIKYQNSAGTLRLGGGLTATQISAIDAGKLRAQQQLELAASLSVSSNTLKVTNLTGHKLISGYPEGRRMWLNFKWYDTNGNLIREDGAYDTITVNINGAPTQVKSILNLDDPNTKIYESHPAMTQEWANQLLGLGYDPNLPLSFDRITGQPDYTLADLAAQAPGTAYKTFHFVLNNTILKDNRIPPYGFSYEEARKRNALPVPANQYGGTPGGTYNYWDTLTLNPPTGAVSGTINLLYQPTSWEYVQFLYEANDGSNTFLAQEGTNLLDAWLNTGMAEPYVMASTTWGAPQGPGAFSKNSPTNGATGVSTNPTLSWGTSGGATSYEYCLNTANVCNTWTSTGANTSVTLSGLNEGTLYYWQVRAKKDSQITYANGSETTLWSFTTMTTPPAAFNKSAPANGATDISTSPSLSWGTSTGATSYEYCYDTSNDDDCTGWSSTGTATSIALSGLSDGTTYYWQVRANNTGGITYANGSETAYWSFTTLTTVTPPGAFIKTAPLNGAAGVPTSPTLEWGASSGATSYEYCYDTSNDDACSTWTSTGTSTTKTLNGLSEGTTYYWHVRAINTGGTIYANGSATAFWSFTTLTTVTPPGAFNKISPENGTTGVSTSPTLEWGASSGATSYEYCYDTSNDDACSTWTSTGTSTSKALTGLSEGTTYYWHVRAINTGGTTYANGSATAFWSFTTPITPPGAFGKTAPLNNATNVTTSPTLEWEPSTGATNYDYCINTTAACTTWTSTDVSIQVVLSNLNEGTTYYWQVRAINSVGTTYANGSESAFWSFTTVTSIIPPSAFNKSTPVDGATDVPINLDLTWSTSTYATSYEYCLSLVNSCAEADWLTNGASISKTLSGLSNNTTYYWHVRAKNSMGTTYADGSPTALWSFTTTSQAAETWNIFLPLIIK